MIQILPQLDYLSKLLSNQNFKLTNIQELTNGIVIYDVLMKLKYFSNQKIEYFIEEPTSFVHKLSNLKSIVKLIQKYWMDELKKQFIIEKQIDLIKISKNNDGQQIKKLVRLVVRTLLNSQQRQSFIEPMLQTSQKTQQYFMRIFQESLGNVEKTQTSTLNRQHFIYDKIEQLESENEKLLKLLCQLHEQKMQISHRQKELEDKFTEKQTQIKRLTWKLAQFLQQKRLQHEQISILLREQQINHELKQQVGQLQEKERILSEYLQKQKMIMDEQLQKLRDYDLVTKQLKTESEENFKLRIKIQVLESTLSQANSQISQKINMLNLLNQTSECKDTEIKNLKSNLQIKQAQIKMKDQLVEQLQDNIKHLTLFQSLQSSSSHNFEPKSSIRNQCLAVSAQYKQSGKQLILLKQNKEMQNLTIQLKAVIQHQNVQIQKLNLYKQQNKKLVQMISHMNKYRGQQNEVLYKCLYKMRMKMLGKQMEGLLKQTKKNQKQNKIVEPLKQIKNKNF